MTAHREVSDSTPTSLRELLQRCQEKDLLPVIMHELDSSSIPEKRKICRTFLAVCFWHLYRKINSSTSPQSMPVLKDNPNLVPCWSALLYAGDMIGEEERIRLLETLTGDRPGLLSPRHFQAFSSATDALLIKDDDFYVYAWPALDALCRLWAEHYLLRDPPSRPKEDVLSYNVPGFLHEGNGHLPVYHEQKLHFQKEEIEIFKWLIEAWIACGERTPLLILDEVLPFPFPFEYLEK